MKILKEVENVTWFDRDNRWAVVGKVSGQVHAVFAGGVGKHHAKLFCDAIEVHDDFDPGYEIFRVEGSIDW